jgi:hypothetical protein
VLRAVFELVRVLFSPREISIASERSIRREPLSALHHADVVRLLAAERGSGQRFVLDLKAWLRSLVCPCGSRSMSSKIFVANFPFSTTSEELEELFGQHGEVVSAKVATDRETGRSRGFGFVEMGSPDAAAAAIQQLNGFDLGGRPLAVRVAEDRGGPGGGGGGRPGGNRGGPGGPRRDSFGRPPRRQF